jgi:phosphonate transport system substrate-binding protein
VIRPSPSLVRWPSMAYTRLRFATCLAPNVRPMYAAVTEWVGARLGLPAELVTCDDYHRLEVPEEDVHFVCSLPYVLLARRSDPPIEVAVAPVLRGWRYGGRPVYFSDVVVRRDSTVRSFEELRGRVWAYNEPMSHSGHGMVRFHLARLGETGRFFGRVVEAGFHETALDMVRRGEVEAAAIDSQVWEVALRDDPALGGDLRVVASLGPSTIQPVTLAGRLPEELRQRIREALLAMGDDPAGRVGLALGLAERFVPVTDADYDDIRAMRDAADAAGIELDPAGAGRRPAPA